MPYRDAVQKIKKAILQSRYRVAANANAEILNLYYGVGEYISANTRAEKWGTGAISAISEQLQGELPGLHGFSPSNMKNMRIFFEKWSSALEPIRQLPTAELQKAESASIRQSATAELQETEPALIRQSPTAELQETESALIRQLPTAELGETKARAFYRLSFTHHREILRKCKNIEERWHYILRCANEFWSVAVLKKHLRDNDFASYGNMPNNFALTMPDEKNSLLAMRSFRDEYLLDYINIKDSDDYDERDVENAIVAEIKKFVMTMGEGFSFIGNQYRLLVDDEEFFVDLLFFNRNLQCLVAIELKKDKFRPADLGQLSFYLSALDSFVRKPNENKTIGILLCQDINRAVVELAVRDYDKPMGVATYRLGTGIPEPYTSLIPLIDGVQQIMLEKAKNVI